MAREHSNKRPAKKRSSASQQFLVITVTFLLGYLTATVCDNETISHWIDAQVLAHHEMNQAGQQNKPKAQQEAAIPPKPKFEFYTLLANEKVPNTELAKTNATAAANTAVAKNAESAVQTAAVNTAGATVPKTTHPAVAVVNKPAAPVASGRGAYSVQVASFKARHDAEHMKGVLSLKGFSVTIVPINHATKGNWFRVVVGPYANRTLAQNAQIDLAKRARLQGMIVAG